MTTTTLVPEGSQANPSKNGVGAPRVALNAVSKRFGSGDNGVLALDGVSLQVQAGEFVCLVGASGCGKTTLLNLVAGLDHPTAGEVVLSGKAALMFQESALFPWLSVGKNVELALRLQGVPRKERKPVCSSCWSSSAWRRSSTSSPTSSPAACASGSRWPGRWPRRPTSCSWTSRSARSTP